jgi:hypothetical protein
MTGTAIPVTTGHVARSTDAGTGEGKTTMTHGSTGRRAAAISTGTLLLCLWGGGTAFAATAPVSDGSTGGVLGGVTGLLSPSPTPTAAPLPVPTPSELAPVSSTVDQVTKTVTTAVQSAPAPSATPTAVPTGGQVDQGGGRTTTGGNVKLPSTGSHDHVLGTRHSRTTTGAPTVSSVPYLTGGLRADAPAAMPALDPKLAPQQTANLAAGVTPALAPAPQHVALPWNDDRAPRGLFIALATMVIGGLAAGHVKLAQDRLGYTSS